MVQEQFFQEQIILALSGTNHFSSLTRRSNTFIRRTLEKIRKCIFN